MNKLFISILALMFMSMKITNLSFRENQKKYERVKNAYSKKEKFIKKILQEKNINYNSFEIFIRAFKKENLLQIFAKNKTDKKFQLLTEYDFCTLSGELGPKRKQGDLQVPEGFYHIEQFNPVSNFYLSLGVNYPNQSDQILGNKNLGGDIFIHGNCVSIGCIPITDEKIMELYILCVETKSNGQEKIPVHIFPAKMDEKGMEFLSENHNSSLNNFWKNLKPAYDFFEKNFSLPEISVNKNGEYIIN